MIIGIMLEENAYLTLNHVDNLVDELLSSILFLELTTQNFDYIEIMITRLFSGPNDVRIMQDLTLLEADR